MKFEASTNYIILSNSIDKRLLERFSEYNIVDESLDYSELKEKIENYLQKTIVFNDNLRKFTRMQRRKLKELMKIRNVNFINITSDIEQTLLGDYIYVYDKDTLVMEGAMDSVLSQEKILKRLGFGLPFVVDLSLQLNYYNVLDKIHYDMESLVDDLWS